MGLHDYEDEDDSNDIEEKEVSISPSPAIVSESSSDLQILPNTNSKSSQGWNSTHYRPSNLQRKWQRSLVEC